MSEWISTKERLPALMQPVIVARVFEAGKPMKVEQGRLMPDGWWKVFGANTRHVDYWMPMPEPPEETA